MIGLLRVLFGRRGEQVSAREAVQRINRGAVLLDVRGADEFAAGHAPQAQRLSAGEVGRLGPQAIDALGIAATGEVLLICHSGLRSRMAQAVLRAADPRRRYVNVSGGMAAWAACGLPVARQRAP